ncbi:MAG: T9SS type A sorting domain-containing protein, partial [Candidatus Marinimicrobia bacterium]|nr:T9SS type A sorting domain-containing protein [Candidatus Neomarinimicrobiota bacterium]
TVFSTDNIDTTMSSDVWDIMIDISNTLAINENMIPDTYVLHQNYPNPFNPITMLRYDLPKDALVNITIYDMLGREVRTLVNTTQDAGFKSVIWNATNNQGMSVSSGVYIYSIEAGEFTQTKKMVLLK